MHAQIAQLVEQRTENPRVAGSIPALGIIFLHIKRILCVEFFINKKALTSDRYIHLLLSEFFSFG